MHADVSSRLRSRASGAVLAPPCCGAAEAAQTPPAFCACVCSVFSSRSNDTEPDCHAGRCQTARIRKHARAHTVPALC